MKAKLVLVLLIILIMAGCNQEGSKVPLGLSKYADDVIAGTPNNISRAISVESSSVLLDKLFKNQFEPGNLVGEAKNLDAMIDDLNSIIDIDNNSTNPNYVVKANQGGTLTLPFWGDVIDIDYLVESDFYYAGYKMTQDSQTIVLFSKGDRTQDFKDDVLYYGKKSLNETVIWQALIGLDSNNTKYKSWNIKIKITNGNKFQVQSYSNGMTQKAIGLSDGYFVFRTVEGAYNGGFPTGQLGITALFDYSNSLYTHVDSHQSEVKGDFDDSVDNALLLITTEITKPDGIDATYWTEILAYINDMGDPRLDNVAPQNISTFNNTFISSKF